MSRPLKLILATAVLLAAAAIGARLLERGAARATEPAATFAATPETLAELNRELGLAGALDSLEAVVAGDASLLEQAHHWTHELARGAMRASGYDIRLVGECRPVFHSGCYHGTLEEYLGNGPPVQAGQVGGLCALIDPSDVPGRLECAHGVGHGLIAGLDHDLHAALEHCGEFSGADAQWCYSGAFMENVVAAIAEADAAGEGHDHGTHQMHDGPADEPHDHLRADDPHYPCTAVAEGQLRTCYLYQSFELLRRHEFDAAAALAACHTSPPAGLEHCYEGMGTQLAGLRPERPAQVHRLCATGDSRLADRCVAGAAEYLVDLGWDPARGFAFCGAAEPGTLEACYRRVGERIGMIHADAAARESACATAPAGAAAAACRAGARLDRPAAR